MRGFIIILAFAALNLLFWCGLFMFLMGDPGFIVGFIASVIFALTPLSHPKWLVRLVLP